MLDRDLAELYEVETRVLNQAVKRNSMRFPAEFMFQLTNEETENWKSQIVMSNSVNMGLRKNPYAFTEQGVAMLSAVLKSPTAIQVSISIINAFVHMRRFLIENRLLIKSIEELRKRIESLEESNEDTLTAINDLSEDSRRELDDIYMALAEMATKKTAKPKNAVGYSAILRRDEEL